VKDIIRPGLILMAYGLVAGLALGIINSKTAPIIAEQEEAARMAAIEAVLPEAVVFVTDTADGVEFITGYIDEEHSEIAGYVVTAHGAGFSSTIRTVVGLSTDFTVKGIEIVFQAETPGLGTKILEVRKDEQRPWFVQQFDGREIGKLEVDKDGGELVSITGATITSRAVARSVADAADKLKTSLEKASPPIERLPEETEKNDILETAEGGEE